MCFLVFSRPVARYVGDKLNFDWSEMYQFTLKMDPNLKELNDSEVTNLQNSGPAVTSADRTEIKNNNNNNNNNNNKQLSLVCVCVCVFVAPQKIE